MKHPGNGRPGAGSHVGRSSRERAGRWQAAEERRGDVGCTLRDELAIRTMAPADHAVSHDGGKQRLDPCQESDRERTGKELSRAFEWDMRNRQMRKLGGDAAEAFASSMRQRISMARVYRRALNALPATVDGQPPLPLPETCPVTLDELLADAE